MRITKVSINNVSLVKRKITILDKVSLTLPEVGIIGLIGRNGAGKTSLLSLLASYELPTKGSILIDDEQAFEADEKMAQVLFVYPRDFSEDDTVVSDYIEWIEQYRSTFDREYAISLIDKFNLPLNKAMNTLSKGMQSAFNIIMGLASRAPVTIFDEAYLSMDEPSRTLFYEELMKELSTYPRLFIISTHLVSEAEYLFDEVVILHEGRVLVAEDYNTLIEKGCTITGLNSEVDAFTHGYNILHEKNLGRLKAVTLYNVDNKELQSRITGTSLDISPISLQVLFSYLTQEG